MSEKGIRPSQPEKTSYDEVPYESHPFAQSHPNTLATVATLFGLRPPPVPKASVLELGCASGGNLIPIAEQFPETLCIGVDLSARQIADAQSTASALGLGNIEFRHADILDIDAALGRFDYIIAHGVFSWVSNAVQEKIFDVLSHNLASNGVAYVSYNTYPGWHMREMVRHMMCYHAAKFSTPTLQLQQARAVITFLADSVKDRGDAYEVLLRQEVENLQRSADSYLYHDHMEEVNDPVYFHEFIERASAKGLRYLGEAHVGSMMTDHLVSDVRSTLRFLAADQIQAEQYLDFLRNRMFRQTLLCRADVAVNWNIQSETLRNLCIGSGAIPLDESVSVRTDESASFRTPSGMSMSTGKPLLKAAMLCLREAWPQTVPFGRLCELTATRLGTGSTLKEEEKRALASGLLDGFLHADLVELRACPWNIVTTVSDRPTASPLARRQTERGRRVTNRRHEVIGLNELERRMLLLLDGKHARTQLLHELVRVAAIGELVLRVEDQELNDPTRIRQILDAGLDENLQNLAQKGVLIA